MYPQMKPKPMHPRPMLQSATALLLALLALSPPALGQDSTTAGWRGLYRYESDGGTSAAGSGIVVTYELVLAPGASRGDCLLKAEGFQTGEQIICHVAGDAKRLAVNFHRYADGRLVNKYGVALYKPGQTLLSLERQEGKPGLTTTWEALRPDGPENAPTSGRFFERVP